MSGITDRARDGTMGNKKFSLILLFILFWILLFWGTGTGGFFVKGSGYSILPSFYGIGMGLAVGIVLAIIAVRFKERILLKAAHASKIESRRYPKLLETVKQYAKKYRVPTPHVYSTPEMLPNFYIFGSSLKNLNIVFTRGFLDLGHPEYISTAIAWAITAEKHGYLKNRTVGSALAYMMMFPAKIWDFLSLGSGSRYNIMNLIFLLPFAPLAALIVHMAGVKEEIGIIDSHTTDMTGDQGYLGVTFIEIEKNLSNFIVDTDLALVPLFVAPPRCSNFYYTLFRPFPPLQKRIKRLSMARKHARKV